MTTRPIIAVVLAGGAGKRFWPFSANKTFFPFLGKSLFDISTMSALPREVDRVVVVSSNENQGVIARLKFDKPSLTVLQPQPLGMADALLSAKGQLRDASLLILIADDVVSSDLYSQVIAYARKNDVFAVVPGWNAKEYFPGGYLKIDGKQIRGIVEKPMVGQLPSPYVAISGHFIKDSNLFLDELEKTHSDADDVYERALTMLAVRENVHVLPYEGGFASLKYPWNVLDVLHVLWNENFASHKGKGVEIKANVVMEGPVHLGNNVRIFENTKIIGPTYIGDGTIIGNNNIVRHSYIGRDCVTGFNTDITRSYIGDSCWFHSNYIGDSVLEGNISMGSGAVLANLRLDDGEISSTIRETKVGTGRTKLGSMIATGVRIGVNASVMPGIKIGRDSFIGAGVTVDRDIPERSFVAPTKNAFTITPNTKSGTAPDRDKFKKIL